MPELPEVENMKVSLEDLGARGQRFSTVDLRCARLRTPLRTALSRLLPGQSILGLHRRAKFLLFETEKFCLINHLGMTGSWRSVSEKESLRKHDHVLLSFTSGLKLAYNDPRRFGLLEIVKRSELDKHAWLKNLGPEPLDEVFNGEYLFKITRGLKSPIKAVIMDQKRVVGVGNIYASEALFRSGIKPTRAANRLKRSEAESLVHAIRAILVQAISSGGSTIRDYKNSRGESGHFQDLFAVYGRAHEPCVKCRKPVSASLVSGRNTFWCARCQS